MVTGIIALAMVAGSAVVSSIMDANPVVEAQYYSGSQSSGANYSGVNQSGYYYSGGTIIKLPPKSPVIRSGNN
ncbi:MAG TPA: hypothetical protein PKC14_01950, partial [Candidatus Absconditabacterales bacterium]|nr:hypothetical protein [Candidatus Absconditabacterales bacterium]